MTMPDPDTDPIPHGGEAEYGFFANLVGLPLLERRLINKIEQLISTTAADTAALEAARDTLTAADTTIDQIEPAPLNHKQKGTKR